MLDENLPTFYFKPILDTPLSTTVYLSQNGSELQPEYTLRRADPRLPTSANRYGVALYDSHNPEIVYAEVNVIPEWTQPSLSQAEIRAQNGAQAPLIPIVPNSFAIQLYNPDQQVVIRQLPKSWNSSAYWEFEMPKNTFRVPSASVLDRGQSDPAASAITPKITFKWKKDGKLSRDISCCLPAKSTDGKKTTEPDIPVAMFKGGKNLTVYQPNMHRVDVEDTKGLEVVLLLSAVVIKDVFFNANRDVFNMNSPNATTNPNRIRKNSIPIMNPARPNTSPVMSGALSGASSSNTPASQVAPQDPRPQQPSSPRAQWEIDAETARLKALVKAEEKQRALAEREEERRIKKMLEAEEKEQRRKDAEIAKETERLRKQYGVPVPPMHPRPQQQWSPNPQVGQHFQTAANPMSIPVRPMSSPSGPPPGGYSLPAQNPWLFTPRPAQGNSPYMQGPGQASAGTTGFLGNLIGRKPAKKRSVYF